MSTPSQVESIFFAALDKKTRRSEPVIWITPAATTPSCAVGWNGSWRPIPRRWISWPGPPSSVLGAIHSMVSHTRPGYHPTQTRGSPTMVRRRSRPAGGHPRARQPSRTDTDHFVRRHHRPPSNRRTLNHHRGYVNRTRRQPPLSGSERRRSGDACRSPGDHRNEGATDRRFRSHRRIRRGIAG